MQYGLKKETIKKINTLFAKYEEVEEAVLYGSRAKGNYKPGSDVDLTLKGKQLNLKLLNKISLDLDDLLLPYTFDLSIYHHITASDLIEHIERVGKIFYKRECLSLRDPVEPGSLPGCSTGVSSERLSGNHLPVRCTCLRATPGKIIG